MQTHRVCNVAELAEGRSVVTTWQQRDVAVFRFGGEVFALDDCCPHAGASLAGGHLEDGCVTCPWHAWRFRLADGAWADSPRVKTRTYAVHILGDEIHIANPPPAPEPSCSPASSSLI
jgi:nitrite reductase (NADH) small subunit